MNNTNIDLTQQSMRYKLSKVIQIVYTCKLIRIEKEFIEKIIID